MPPRGGEGADEATSTERPRRTDGIATRAKARAGATGADISGRAQSGRIGRARQGEHAKAEEAKTDGRRRARRRAMAEGRARGAPTPLRPSSRGVPSAVPSSAPGEGGGSARGEGVRGAVPKGRGGRQRAWRGRPRSRAPGARREAAREARASAQPCPREEGGGSARGEGIRAAVPQGGGGRRCARRGCPRSRAPGRGGRRSDARVLRSSCARCPLVVRSRARSHWDHLCALPDVMSPAPWSDGQQCRKSRSNTLKVATATEKSTLKVATFT